MAQLAPPVTDSDTALARGVVLGAHSLKKSKDLDFGVVAVDPVNSGTVSIAASAAGNRTVGGGVTSLTSTYSAAEFDGSAAPNEQVVLTMSGPATASVQDGGGNSIPVALVLDAAGATRNADGAGGFTVYVGGTFQIAGGQTPGVYSNTFDLTAEYQ
ncbi:DUF4402 domain-containing protein [Sphingomonas sp.]|uniref:DUF4402 domain-containing protein n=1 Tax=Sphingomonas sp. TaxID=28214 RepID=UPI0038B30D93